MVSAREMVSNLFTLKNSPFCSLIRDSLSFYHSKKPFLSIQALVPCISRWLWQPLFVFTELEVPWKNMPIHAGPVHCAAASQVALGPCGPGLLGLSKEHSASPLRLIDPFLLLVSNEIFICVWIFFSSSEGLICCVSKSKLLWIF